LEGAQVAEVKDRSQVDVEAVAPLTGEDFVEPIAWIAWFVNVA